MSFSQGELDALRRTYASGTLRVTHDGRTVQYDDTAGLERRIRFIEDRMVRDAGHKRARFGVAGFSRGDR